MRVKSVITLTKQSWKWILMRKAAVMPESLTNAFVTVLFTMASADGHDF